MEQLPESIESTGDAEPTSIAVIAASIGAYFGKMPAALQRNIAKAVGHLFKVPNALLDGLADEIKATSAARVKIMEATGNKLAESITIDNTVAQIAVQTHASKILRQQKNAIKVLHHAAEEMSHAVPSNDAPEPQEISEDWLNAFESEAINMSSDQMQRLFGKMLAGEIRRPSTYSIRTIKLVGQMDFDVAEIFRRFCSLCCSSKVGEERRIIDGRALALGKRNVVALHDFGLPHSQMLMLEEYGLITGMEPTSFPYDMSIIRQQYSDKTPVLPLTYVNKVYMLYPKPPKTSDDFERYGIYGIALSRVGKELMSIVEVEENPQYTDALVNFLNKEGLQLFELPEEMGIKP